MEYSYDIGLSLTIWLSVILGSIAFVVWWAIGVKGDELIIDVLYGALPASVIGLAFFATIFTVLNPLLQLGNLNVTLLSDELRNGVLGLRVSSLLLGCKALSYALYYLVVEEGGYLREYFNRPSREYDELTELPERQDLIDPGTIILSQYGIYLIVLANLWVMTAYGASSTLVVFLNWAFFFIVDDWAIIADYSRTLRGRVLRWHRYRVHCFNVLLTVGLVIAAVQTFTWIGTTLSVVLVAIFVFYRNIARIDAQLQTPGEAYVPRPADRGRRQTLGAGMDLSSIL